MNMSFISLACVNDGVDYLFRHHPPEEIREILRIAQNRLDKEDV